MANRHACGERHGDRHDAGGRCGGCQCGREGRCQVTEASIRERLAAARDGSNQLLNTETLDSPDAEAARRAQLGNSLGARQDAVSSESSALVVADPATEASVSGLTKSMGAAIGLVAGLLLGGLVSMLLSVRGLRVSSARTLRYLVPETRLSSTAEAAQLSGQIIESGMNCVAIVSMDGTEKQGLGLRLTSRSSCGPTAEPSSRWDRSPGRIARLPSICSAATSGTISAVGPAMTC